MKSCFVLQRLALGSLFVTTLLAASSAAAAGDAKPIEGVLKFDYTKELESFNTLFAGVEYNPAQTNTFYTALSNGEIHKWNDGEAAPKWQLSAGRVENGAVEDIAVSQDGSILAAVGGDAFIGFYDAGTGKALDVSYTVGSMNPLPLVPHFTSIAFAPGGELFATGDANGNIFVWSVSSPAPLTVFQSENMPIKQLMFSDSGGFLVSLNSREVIIWNVNDGSQAVDVSEDLASGPFWAEAAHFPHYERVIVITTYHDIVLYDLSSQEILKRYPLAGDPENGERAQPLLVAVNPDMTHLWRFNKEPLIEHLDLETGEPVQAYIDPTIFEGGGFAINAYVSVTRKPGSPNKYVAGVLTWQFDIGNDELTMLTRLRKYRLPL